MCQTFSQASHQPPQQPLAQHSTLSVGVLTAPFAAQYAYCTGAAASQLAGLAQVSSSQRGPPSTGSSNSSDDSCDLGAAASQGAEIHTERESACHRSSTVHNQHGHRTPLEVIGRGASTHLPTAEPEGAAWSEIDYDDGIADTALESILGEGRGSGDESEEEGAEGGSGELFQMIPESDRSQPQLSSAERK